MECDFIRDCAEMAARASLYRTESRWGLYHYRLDYPEMDDDNWFVHVNLKKDADGRWSRSSGRSTLTSSRWTRRSCATTTHLRIDDPEAAAETAVRAHVRKREELKMSERRPRSRPVREREQDRGHLQAGHRERGRAPAQTTRASTCRWWWTRSKCITGCQLCIDSCPVDCLAIHPATRSPS